MPEQYDRNAYQYDALPNSKTHLRLLKVIQGAFDQHVICELTTWPVDRTPAYNAISYTWGDSHLTSTITINGKAKEIRQNCRYVLQQAHAFSHSDYYWCDAICVDQSNNLEKGDQVAMFGSLYAKARHVLVCVGEHKNNSKILFEVLRQKSKILEDIVSHAKASERLRNTYLPQLLRSKEIRRNQITELFSQIAAHVRRLKGEPFYKLPPDHGTWSSDPPVVGQMLWLRCALNRGKLSQEGLRDAMYALRNGVRFEEREQIMRSFVEMMQRPYFTRLWVLQELQLGQNKIMCCGEDHAPFDTLFGLHQLVKVWQWDLYAPGVVRSAMEWINKRHAFTVGAIRIGSDLHKVQYQLGCLKLGVLENRPIDLPHLLDAMVHFQCADARDRIYGSLALATWADWMPLDHKIVPDYAIDTFVLAQEVLNILLWHCGKVLYNNHPYDFLYRARNLRQLLEYTPEQVTMQEAIAARSGPSEQEQSVIMARLPENGWFGVPISEYSTTRDESGLYCSKRESSGSPRWVELINCHGKHAPDTNWVACSLLNGLSHCQSWRQSRTC